MRIPCLAVVVGLLAACNNEVFIRDGVTDGDTFYLAERALSDNDPVLQSWVSYSLSKSTCQLDVGGPIPSRVSTYGCELMARTHLLETWAEQQAGQPDSSDAYLDSLARVREAGMLPEYVVHYYGRDHWQLPAELDMAGFRNWRRSHLRGHRPERRIVGSWNWQNR